MIQWPNIHTTMLEMGQKIVIQKLCKIPYKNQNIDIQT